MTVINLGEWYLAFTGCNEVSIPSRHTFLLVTLVSEVIKV